MRIKGDEYDADAADVETLEKLRRVVPIPTESDADDRAYATRELQASVPVAAGTRARRRAASFSERLSTEAPPPSPDEK
jgi:hypothetical protein